MVKNTPANAEDAGLIPGLGRSSEDGNGNPFQYSCLKNSMDRRAWGATVPFAWDCKKFGCDLVTNTTTNIACTC